MATAIMYDSVTGTIRLIGEGIYSLSSDFKTVKGEGWEWEGLSFSADNLVVINETPPTLKVGEVMFSNFTDIKTQFIRLSTEEELANVVFDSMSDKIKIAQLESDLGNAVMEIMTLEMGVS